jgi:hypothetical protein
MSLAAIRREACGWQILPGIRHEVPHGPASQNWSHTYYNQNMVEGLNPTWMMVFFLCYQTGGPKTSPKDCLILILPLLSEYCLHVLLKDKRQKFPEPSLGICLCKIMRHWGFIYMYDQFGYGLHIVHEFRFSFRYDILMIKYHRELEHKMRLERDFLVSVIAIILTSILYIQRQSTAFLILGCYWPCRNPCLFDVELATKILSLF